MKKIKFVFIVIFIILLLDILINIVLPKKFTRSFGIMKNFSLYSEKFHHLPSENIGINDYWGNKKFKVYTNEYSLRVKKEDRSLKIKSNKNYNAFIGDSFVWGIGLNYEDHFINKLNKIEDNNINIGYVSWSPSIYHNRIKYLINKKVKFDNIFIFLDHSDIADEGLLYFEEPGGNIVRPWRKNKTETRNKIENFFKNYSFIYRLSQIIHDQFDKKNYIHNCKNKKIIKGYCFDLDTYNRFAHGYDNKIFKEKWVKKGQTKSENYVKKLKDLSIKNSFDIILVYYPSGLEVLEGIEFNKSEHFKFIKKLSILYNLKLINLNPIYENIKDPKKNYEYYFIKNDIHWNEESHKQIFNFLKKNLK